MAREISLTGIKPTGTPHLGNYVGAVKPALDLTTRFDAIYFIADYHALTTITDPAELRRFTLEVAATWLAFGLDPTQVVFYRQSDIPQIFELSWLLATVTPKGLMDRAHAYKAAVDEGRDVNLGVFTYPVLMAADILMFKADVVPVGRDQQQHVEMARDIAGKF